MKRWLLAVGIAAICLPSTRAIAQQGSGRVTGTVTAETGEPVMGAQVVVLTTRHGAITNAEGRYTIVGVPAGQYKIKASRIGFTPMILDSVPVTADQVTTADFKLTHAATRLEQVVVVGYGTQRRRDVTGAVASVQAADLKQDATTNVVDALRGKVAGVDIVSTGFKPGDGVRIRIRGTRSIKASNDPLYVLDGIPMAGGIGDLNPTDIESIDILKDASATAIYGSRGANGVVLITTKHGAAGRTSVTYDTYYGAQQASKKVRVMNGPEFADYKREAYRATGEYYKYCPGSDANYTGTACDAGDKDAFYAAELSALSAGVSTDWASLITRQGGLASNELTVTGGNDRTQYALSGNLVRNQGVILSQDYDRKSMRVNIETQANARLRFGGSALVVRSNQNLGRGDGLFSGALRDVPLGLPYDSTGAVLFKPTPDPLRDNPLSDVANWIDNHARTRAFGTLYGMANLAEGLDYRVNFGPDITYDRHGDFQGAFTENNQGGTSTADLAESRVFDYTLDNILSYKRGLGVNHNIDATLLYSIEKDNSDNNSASVLGLPYESQQFWNLGSASTITGVGSNLSQWALQSYMGRVNYSFMDRYLFTLTTRIDGSSRLAPGHKYATFPSAAFAWRAVDRSAFGNGFGPFDNVKIRTSYGITGNTSVNPYQTEGTLSRSIYSFSNNGAFGYRPGELPNPNLRWEKTAQYDGGIDFGMLDNRLTGTIDAYIAKTTDLLMDRKLPPSTGYTQITENVGATQNTGLEVALSHTTLNGWHGLHWVNDANVSVARNKILSLTYGKVSDPGNHWFIGQPIDNNNGGDVWYDYRMIGIWQTADSAQARQYKETPGMIRLQDLSCPDSTGKVPAGGDGVINSCDLQILGNSYPKWTGSFNTHLDWKRFDVGMQVITRQGFMVHNTFMTSFGTLAGRYNNLKVDYWTPANPSNTEPRPNKNQENPVYGDTRGYQDGSFTRVRNITVGFTVPAKYVQTVGAQNLRIYGTAQNPFTWTKFTGLDPEGRTSAGSPPYRTLLLGATFGF